MTGQGSSNGGSVTLVARRYKTVKTSPHDVRPAGRPRRQPGVLRVAVNRRSLTARGPDAGLTVTHANGQLAPGRRVVAPGGQRWLLLSGRDTGRVSYDLIFWTQKPGAGAADPAVVYTRLMEGEPVDGIAVLPIEDMVSDLSRAFPDAVREPNGTGEWLVWEESSRPAVLEVTWTDQYLHASCRNLTNDELNRVIDVAVAHGGRLYDPQTRERFAES